MEENNIVKLNELRTGNKIYFIECHPEDSKLDKKIAVSVSINDFEYIKDNNSLFETIPLTEEWLLNFGFNCAFSSDPQEQNASKIYTKPELQIYQPEEETPYFITCINYEMEMLEIKHIHQLQNFYFAITGKELELNK